MWKLFVLQTVCHKAINQSYGDFDMPSSNTVYRAVIITTARDLRSHVLVKQYYMYQSEKVHFKNKAIQRNREVNSLDVDTTSGNLATFLVVFTLLSL